MSEGRMPKVVAVLLMPAWAKALLVVMAIAMDRRANCFMVMSPIIFVCCYPIAWFLPWYIFKPLLCRDWLAVIYGVLGVKKPRPVGARCSRQRNQHVACVLVGNLLMSPCCHADWWLCLLFKVIDTDTCTATAIAINRRVVMAVMAA